MKPRAPKKDKAKPKVGKPSKVREVFSWDEIVYRINGIEIQNTRFENDTLTFTLIVPPITWIETDIKFDI